MPRKPSEQGPNPLSPRHPRRSPGFGGKGPGKRDAFGGSPERGKRVNTPRAGGSWGGSSKPPTSSGDGCMVLVVGVLIAIGGAGTEIVRWLS
jgi:hypothetical protein